MRTTLRLLPVLVTTLSLAAEAQAPAVRARVDSLLARMTLEEKIGQMTQVTLDVVAARGVPPAQGARLDSARLREAIVKRGVGSIINVTTGALSATQWQAIVGEIQQVARRETRLGVPILYGIDAVHGHNYLREGTIFPHHIGLAATFDAALARRVGEIAAEEVLAAGTPWNFAPVLDVARSQAWPRFYETFGEEPFVASTLGREEVLGMQHSGRVAVTLKHYLGYGLPRTGRDRTPASVSTRYVREYALPPFRAAIAAGARSVMVNSGEIDGEPVHASRYWLTDVLRGELGFTGIAVTDWADIDFLHNRHRVAATTKEAVRLAIDAGIDMAMTPLDYRFADDLLTLVREGRITEARIDESVRRILGVKAELGLLDGGAPQLAAASRTSDSTARLVARQAARQSITLLKNAGTLPLARTARVLVTGPAATSLSALHGGWTYTWQGTDTTLFPAGSPTLLDALRRRLPNVRHLASGTFTRQGDLAAVVAAARQADVVIVALGEEGYSEWVGDVRDLTLPEAQLRLAEVVEATGVPTVLVLLQGRPRIIARVADPARAIVMGYWPGMEGAEALAEVLTGEVNPSGRLPFTYPRAPNALDTYDHKYTEALGADFGRSPTTGYAPQFDFGHGLSYTTFAYDSLRVESPTLAAGARQTVRVRVTNTGRREGRESVLLFVRQHYASLTPHVRRLRAFESVALAPGQSRTITFTLGPDELSFVGRDGQPVLEAGDFDVMVGNRTAKFTVTTTGATR